MSSSSTSYHQLAYVYMRLGIILYQRIKTTRRHTSMHTRTQMHLKNSTRLWQWSNFFIRSGMRDSAPSLAFGSSNVRFLGRAHAFIADAVARSLAKPSTITCCRRTRYRPNTSEPFYHEGLVMKTFLRSFLRRPLIQEKQRLFQFIAK